MAVLCLSRLPNIPTLNQQDTSRCCHIYWYILVIWSEQTEFTHRFSKNMVGVFKESWKNPFLKKGGLASTLLFCPSPSVNGRCRGLIDRKRKRIHKLEDKMALIERKCRARTCDVPHETIPKATLCPAKPKLAQIVEDCQFGSVLVCL